MIHRLVRVLLPLALVIASACSSGPSAPDDVAYLKELETVRADKDRQFRETPDCGKTNSDTCSPIPVDKRQTILPLKYFPPDPSFNVPASLTVNEDRPVFEMPTSTGAPRRMQLVGTLHFTLQGEERTLGAFVEDGTEQIVNLFVPFADLTTGKETYAAGRYLDLHPTSTGYYNIDFNRAYNPYCAYNATYECPFPPPSNRLKMAVRAGEKTPGA